MNERTIRILEFPKIISQLAALASSSLGEELARELTPLTDPAAIHQAQQATTEALALLNQGERVPLGGIHDIREPLAKAALGGTLAAAELLAVGSTLRAARLLRQFLLAQGERLTLLAQWGGELASYPAVERELERCLSPEGAVLDKASPKLHNLRTKIKTQQHRIQEKLEGLVHSSDNSKYLQEPLVTFRNERPVIPVKQEYRSLFPGIVHDQSASGATLFIEPMAAVELSNQLRSLESEAALEVERILAELSAQIQAISPEATRAVAVLAQLDLAFAKARYSLAVRGAEPEFNTTGVIELLKARHPLLGPEVVPIDLHLGKKFDTLVITGPNTGGKTVSLKTVGLLALMAQAGLHIPAIPGSSLAIFNQICCDIGDEQSIEQSLSTFSSHLTQIVQIIAAAHGPDCLVLLDELGAGTDPTEGAALAMSILDRLHQQGVRTIATTHYSELKAYAYQTAGIENAAVEFDLETLRPTFHLQIGLPGSSQAFAIAQKLGLPEVLVEQARTYISTEAAQVEQMLQQIEADRRQSREDQQRQAAARREGESFQQKYQTEFTKFRQERDELLRQAKAEARQVLLEARRQSENLLRRLREAKYEELPEIVNQARQEIGRELEDLTEAAAPAEKAVRVAVDDLKPGVRVRVLSLDQVGTVLEVRDESVQVQVGIIKVDRPLNDLELTQEEPVTLKRGRSGNAPGIETAAHISPEIMLRGLTVDEALYQLEKYFDQAVMAGLTRLRVIHGKGTGTLRQVVWEYLKGNSLVKTFYIAEQNEGGMGATVVELKKG